MADNKRRGRFGRGSDDDVPQSIFDLFEPPPDQDAATFTRIPIIRDDAELDLTDAGMVEAQMAAEAEAAGLAHWTEPPTGQVPKALASAVTQDDKWADMRGPSWQGEEPNWAGPDLSDVFADTEAISHRRVVESDDDLTIDATPTPPPPSRQIRAERPERAAHDPAPQPRVAPPPAPNGSNGRPGAPVGTPPAPSVFGDRPAVAGRPTAPPPGAAAFDDRQGRPAATADQPPAAGRGRSAFDERQSARGVSAFDERQAARGPASLDERQAARGPSVFDDRPAPQAPSAFDERQAARSGAVPPDPGTPQSVFDDRRRLGSPPPPPAASRPSPPPAPAPAARPPSQPGPAAQPPAAGQPGPAPTRAAPARALPPDATQPGPVGGRLLAPDPTPAGSPPPPAGRASGPAGAGGAARAAASPQVATQRGRLPGVRLEGPDSGMPGGPPSGAVRRGAHDAPPPGGDPTLRPARAPMPERGPVPNRAPQPQPQAPPHAQPQPQAQGGPAAPAERMGRFEQHPLDDPRAAGRFEAGPQRRPEVAPPGYDDEEYEAAPAGGASPAKSIGPRVVVGVALAALVGVALGLGPTVTMLLVGVLTLLAVMELFNTMRIAGLRPATLLGLVGAVALPAAAYVRGETGYPLVIGLAVIFGMLWYLTGADTERPVLNLGLTFLGVLWVGGLAGFAALMLRAEESVQLLAATIAITAISDTFAYFGGRAYGTKPFHPASPNKTWEGTFTGFFGALVAGLVIGVSGLFDLFDGKFTAVMALAALVGLLAPIGDLHATMKSKKGGITPNVRSTNTPSRPPVAKANTT